MMDLDGPCRKGGVGVAGRIPHIELKVMIPGEGGTTDARRSFTLLERLMTLLAQLEAGALGSAGSTWGIERLQLGSVMTVLTPNRLAEDATGDLMADLAEWAISGFSATEEGESLPEHWPPAAIDTGVELSKQLGLLESDGMTLELLTDGRTRRRVVVTRRSADNLQKVVRRRRTSIGSVIGRLESITVHNTLKAGLWTERGGRRVEVGFTREQKESVQHALGKRVEISGMLTRDARDRAISIKMRRIEQLPEQHLPLEGIAGADPDLTGGLEAAEHVRRLHDAS
ncbi:hypothetical protein AB0K60_22405 [Thermopolyspora sp. NPDC052614]|uniref:hypothetical protein n=1 Tax=Thermopolyspora sp. NPDC052614 TaxID=3155682 RepID=UPI003434CC67